MSQTLSQDRPTTLKTFAFLTGDGDNVYGWDETDASWVIPMIQTKIDEGYDFWIVKRFPLREVKLTRAEDARALRKVTIKDPHARQLFEQGRIGIVARPVAGRDDEYVLERRAASAEDAAANDTVASPRMRGG